MRAAVALALMSCLATAAASAQMAAEDFATPFTAAANDPASVEAIQRGLEREGYSPGPLDGVVGPQTERAIREYQTDNGLPVTGAVSPGLLSALSPEGAEQGMGTVIATAPPQPAATDPALMIGKPVHAFAGDRIGWIENLLVDANGSVRTVVVAVESRLGAEWRTALLPWEMFADDQAFPAALIPLTREEAHAKMTGPVYRKPVWY